MQLSSSSLSGSELSVVVAVRSDQSAQPVVTLSQRSAYSFNTLPTISKSTGTVQKTCTGSKWSYYTATFSIDSSQVSSAKLDVSVGGTVVDSFRSINFPSSGNAPICVQATSSTTLATSSRTTSTLTTTTGVPTTSSVATTTDAHTTSSVAVTTSAQTTSSLTTTTGVPTTSSTVSHTTTYLTTGYHNTTTSISTSSSELSSTTTSNLISSSTSRYVTSSYSSSSTSSSDSASYSSIVTTQKGTSTAVPTSRAESTTSGKPADTSKTSSSSSSKAGQTGWESWGAPDKTSSSKKTPDPKQSTKTTTTLPYSAPAWTAWGNAPSNTGKPKKDEAAAALSSIYKEFATKAAPSGGSDGGNKNIQGLNLQIPVQPGVKPTITNTVAVYTNVVVYVTTLANAQQSQDVYGSGGGPQQASGVWSTWASASASSATPAQTSDVWSSWAALASSVAATKTGKVAQFTGAAVALRAEGVAVGVAGLAGVAAFLL